MNKARVGSSRNLTCTFWYFWGLLIFPRKVVIRDVQPYIDPNLKWKHWRMWWYYFPILSSVSGCMYRARYPAWRSLAEGRFHTNTKFSLTDNICSVGMCRVGLWSRSITALTVPHTNHLLRVTLPKATRVSCSPDPNCSQGKQVTKSWALFVRETVRKKRRRLGESSSGRDISSSIDWNYQWLWVDTLTKERL